MDLAPEDREQVQSMVFEEMGEVSETIGDLETCKSTDFTWYVEAEADMERYLQQQKEEALKQEEEEEEAEEDEEEMEEPTEDQSDLLENNRTTSYGEGWEDEPLADWVPKKVTGRSRSKGVTYYRVEWQRHNEPTWETEEDLEEEGHLQFIRDYNQEQAAKRKMPKKVSAGGKTERTKRKKSPKYRKSEPTAMFSPTTYWPDYMNRIQAQFQKCGLHVSEVYNVCTERMGKQFHRSWQTDTTKTVPVLLFHGTKLTSIENIVNVGFKIPTPASGIKVINGSAHGVGIYSARTPTTSTYYTDNEYMFVCAGLVSGVFESQVKKPGDMVVFFSERLIMPCFLVKWARGTSTVPPTYHPHFDFDILKRMILQKISYQQNYGSNTANSHYVTLMQRYWTGIAGASTAPPPPTTLASGGAKAGMDYDNTTKTLTKRQLRAAPRHAKQQYKAGLLKQKKNANN